MTITLRHQVEVSVYDTRLQSRDAFVNVNDKMQTTGDIQEQEGEEGFSFWNLILWTDDKHVTE